MSLTKELIENALSGVQEPDLKRDLVSIGAVRQIAVCDGLVRIAVCLPVGSSASMNDLRQEIARVIFDKAAGAEAPCSEVTIEFVDDEGNIVDASRATEKQSTASIRPNSPQPSAGSLPGVKRVIAVGAGKGGVGKSTVSVNLAVGLARKGFAVGLMDGDIYGPSVPTLLGLTAEDPIVREGMIEPFFVHGIKSVTMGRLVPADKPLIWRGPMAHGAFKQLVEQTNWGELDFMIIDLPPGTGDVPLTMSQMMSLDGAVIVCTPQQVAQDDAIRAAGMFKQLNVPLLGVVENMSYFIGDDGKEYDIFGRGGAERMAQNMGIPFLGSIPIHMELREHSDAGDPTANFEGNAQLRDELETFVAQFENQLALAAMQKEQTTPELTIS